VGGAAQKSPVFDPGAHTTLSLIEKNGNCLNCDICTGNFNLINNMHTLVFATNNNHKAREIEQILGSNFSVKTLKAIGCDTDIEETADTLEGNALIKARFVKDHFGFDCFSEDTGLEVAALNGAPGVHTARFAGEQRDPADNMALLLERLEGQADRSARFRTVIAVTLGGQEFLLEGICNGQIALAESGSGGFGYDPVFIPEGYTQTFAELGDAVKNKISHRGLATLKLVELLSLEEDRS
jgi:XTP/dITP diphosphohydrolase